MLWHAILPGEMAIGAIIPVVAGQEIHSAEGPNVPQTERLTEAARASPLRSRSGWSEGDAGARARTPTPCPPTCLRTQSVGELLGRLVGGDDEVPLHRVW